MIVIVIGGLRWMPVARLVRAQFLSLREKEFVEAARALGASRMRLVAWHILPNALGPVIVAATIEVASAIIAESTLSFLGLGFPPDIPTWGRVLFDAKDTLDVAPHWALAAGSAIFITVLAINFIGDGLRGCAGPAARDGLVTALLEIRGPMLSDGVSRRMRAWSARSMASAWRSRKGETLAVVGESGCGKTVTARSVLQLIDMPPGRFEAGRILWQGRDLLPLSSAGEMDRSGRARSGWCSRSR